MTRFCPTVLSDRGAWSNRSVGEIATLDDPSYNHSPPITVNYFEEDPLSYAAGWPVHEWLMDFCLGFTEGLNVIFFHELFKCFCEMEIRKFAWVAFGKKIAVLFCVGMLARGFQILTVKLMEMFWANVATIALDALLPYQLITFAVITVLDTYWVIRIFLAFAENSRFRARGGGNDGR